jgi:hypothetical protein
MKKVPALVGLGDILACTLVPILTQMNPIYTLHAIALTPTLILYSHLSLDFPSGPYL